MRKRLYLLAFICFYSLTAQSQVLIALVFGDKLNSPNVEFGLEVGSSFSTYSGFEDSQWANTFLIGPTFNIRLSDRWWIHPAVQVVSSTGVANLDPYLLGDPEFDAIIDQFVVERRINYFAVPLLARFAVTPHWMLQGGIEPTLRTNAYDLFTADYEEGATIRVDISDTFNRIDARLVAGLAYRFRTETAGLWINLKYAYGLSDIPDPNSDLTSKMQYWQLVFEIPVGASEKKN